MFSPILRHFVRERFLYARTIGPEIARKIIEFAMIGEILTAERLYVITKSLGADIREVDEAVISNPGITHILALARDAAGIRETTSDEALNQLNLAKPENAVFDDIAKRHIYHLSENYPVEEESIEKIVQKEIPTDKYVDADSGYTAMMASQALLAATTIAFQVGNTDKGLELLTKMATRVNANQNLEYMQKIRHAWDYFARGWLRDQLGIDKTKLQTYGEEVVQTVEDRLRGGRRQLTDYYATYSMQDLLEELNNNTIALGNLNPNLFDEWDENNPPSTYLHPPATGEEIADAEVRVEMTLPLELKEALLIANGTEPTRDYLNLRFQTFGELQAYEKHFRQEVDDEDEEEYDYSLQIRPWDDVCLFDDQLKSTREPEISGNEGSQETIKASDTEADLPRITPPWPKLARAMTLNWCHQDINGGVSLFLVEPALVSQAKDNFHQYYEQVQQGSNHKLKKQLDRLVLDYYGTMEQLDKTEWGVLESGLESSNNRFWPGIRAWMCDIVWRSRDWLAMDTSPVPAFGDETVHQSQKSSQTVGRDDETREAEQNEEVSVGEGLGDGSTRQPKKRTQDEAELSDDEPQKRYR